MSLLKWLFNKAPAETDAAPTILGVTPRVTTPDHDEETGQADQTALELDEVFCAIEYTDAAGNQSRRRITLRKLAPGPHAPILTAICHERHAVRHFRTDRIECAITADGEILNWPDFAQRVLAIAPQRILSGPQVVALNSAQRVRDFLRAPISILVLAARADDHLAQSELHRIVDYAVMEAGELDDEGKLPGHADVSAAQLCDLVKAMRPSRESLPGYIAKISDYDPRRYRRFMHALQTVVDADGTLNPQEFELLQEIESELTRASERRFRE